MKQVKIEPVALEVMKQDALRSFPDECCGFIFGNDGEQRTVTLAREVQNSKNGDRRRRFEISPLQYMQAERFAALSGLTLLGVYHSHPLHPAIASEHDRVVAMPFFSYVILSTFADAVVDVKSWQLDNNRHFIEEHVVLQVEDTAKQHG